MSDAAVMLIAFGGPERMQDVRPFLRNVLRGRPVPEARFEAVVDHYAQIGGRSPLLELTQAQATALQQVLRDRGHAVPVVIGMRNWHPFIADTLAALAEQKVQRVVGVIMAAYNTEASDARYRASVAEACSELGEAAPEVSFAESIGSHSGFIRANAQRLRHTLGELPESDRARASLLFTAHSIPVEMAEASPYVAQLEHAAAQVAAAVGRQSWRLCYQSRSGPPRQPWLEPDILDVLREQAAQGVRDVVVAPVGFVSDHVEVLYDLDVEARQLAERLGMRMWRAAAANDHPDFIAALADRVETLLRNDSESVAAEGS